MVSCQSASARSQILSPAPRRSPMPALLSITSSRPKCSTVRAMRLSQAALDWTFVGTMSGGRPDARFDLVGRGASCGLRAAGDGESAPATASAVAIALPSPRLPPVTMATPRRAVQSQLFEDHEDSRGV